MNFHVGTNELRMLGDFLFAIIAILNFVYTWIAQRRKATQDQIAAINEDFAKLRERVSIVENDVSHLPDHKEITKLREMIGQLNKELAETLGGLNGLKRAVDIMNQHLIDQSGKG